MKVIQILAHSPSWITKNIEEDIYDGWHVRTTKAIQKLTDEFELECFLPEKTFRKPFWGKRDGIFYKVFPSTSFTYGREISFPLIREIKKLQEEKTILHIHGLHNYLTYTICQIFRKMPIIIQHHGDCPPLNLLERRKVLMPFISILGFEQIIMNYTLKFVDQFFVLTNREGQALLKIVKPEKITIQGMGVDFTHFYPRDKNEAKKRLNLPISEGQKILLYVGKLQRYKGCDVIIDAFDELRNKYNILLLLVGGSGSDPLYSQAKANGATIVARQPNELMPFFYSAADVTLLPITKALSWRGIGISIIESLACNTPVVAGTLKSFLGKISQVGFVATTKKEVIDGVEFIFRNPEKLANCRTEAQKYFDWSIIAQNTISIYHRLVKEYYGNNNIKS
jgi:glycosyltransferase involved in cell wall biosynthesis